MSALRPQAVPITVMGKSYRILFTLSVLDAIEERYGSVEAMQRRMGIGAEGQEVNTGEAVKAIVFLLATLVNDDIEDRIEQGEQGLSYLDERAIKRSMTLAELVELQPVLMQALRQGAPDAEAVPKNAAAAPPRRNRAARRGIFSRRK